MKEESEISVISRLIPILDSNVIEEHLLTSEFCCPFETLIIDKNEDICDENLKDSDSCQQSILPCNDSHINKTVCSCILDTSNDSTIRKMKIKMELLFFSIVMSELKRSKAFRSNVLSNFFAFCHAKSASAPLQKQLCSSCHRFTCKIHVFVYLDETGKQVFNFSW